MSIDILKTYFLITFLFCTVITSGQIDTINLPQDELGLEDIRITADEIANSRVFTASRTLNDVDELPLSIYVVTGDEILKNGYFTLTDVLKSVPGIFVSQPGSAIDGETFMMNGLYGNRHAKILVNNIPVKVNDVSGMPIASQLPIRQAERIEVTYGPSGIMHGTDAGAGVINIITRDSERPVYTHADLGVGSHGYSSVNVLFGGKLGKNKKILKFNAYGSSTELNTVDLNQAYVFGIENYPNNSFVPEPEINRSSVLFPQSSSQVGINLKYRSLSFSTARMKRKEHAALGSNPLSINNQIPQTTYGEKISTYSLAFKKDWKKFGIKAGWNFVDHAVDEESSIEYFQPHLKQLLDTASHISAGGNTLIRDEFIAELDSTYFSGRRFIGGRSINLEQDLLVSIFPFKNLELILGTNIQVVAGSAYNEYGKSPFESGFFNSGNIYRTSNLFAQAYLTLKKLNMIIGLNKYNYNADFGSELREKLLPSFAGLYKINSKLNIRASYASSYMVPAEFLDRKSGFINMEFGEIPRLDQNPINFSFIQNIPQQTTYIDLGFRYNVNEKVRFGLTFFNSTNDNLISYRDEFTPLADGIQIEYGYTNSDKRKSELTGIRFSAIFENIISSRDLNIKMHFSYFDGEQDLPSGEKISRILSQPEYIGQFSLSFRLLKKLNFTIENFFIGPYASRGLQSLDEYATGNIRFTRARRHFADISFNLPLNNNFKMFCKVSNLSSNWGEYGGIDATGSPDDLFYNMQRSPYFQGGVSYTIN